MNRDPRIIEPIRTRLAVKVMFWIFICIFLGMLAAGITGIITGLY